MRPARLLPALLVSAAAALPLPAAAQLSPWSASTSTGPYVMGAFGAGGYDSDCNEWDDCNGSQSNGGKFAAGWRFGVFGLELGYTNYGQARLRPTDERLQLRALDARAVWHLNFGPNMAGLLRTGVAHVQHRRTFDGTHSTLSASFGLGLLADLAPQVAVEVGWDVTAGEGRNSGSVTGGMVSAGLRIAF